jgi:hypothetical protein
MDEYLLPPLRHQFFDASRPLSNDHPQHSYKLWNPPQHFYQLWNLPPIASINRQKAHHNKYITAKR